MSKKGMALCLAVFVICVGIAAWAGEKSSNRVVSERLVVQIDFSSWIRESFKVSPDSKRVAYVVQEDNKGFVVVDGKKGERYDGIMKGTPIFSPDSKRLAYGVGEGNKQFVVVDGEEGKKYDDIVTVGGRKFIFDSADTLHYLAVKGSSSTYLVEEKIK